MDEPLPPSRVEARETHEVEPLGEDASEEAQKVLRRGSGLRAVGKLALGIALLGLSIGGGWLGYRAMLRRQVATSPMVKFPAARAKIGNDLWPAESPAHEVDLAVYALDVTEVTVRDYELCVADGGCTEPGKGGYCTWKVDEKKDHPVNCVNWDQASAFCVWAKKRLPTEKEWEHAARTSYDDPANKDPKKKDLFPWGAAPPSSKLANVCGAECGSFFGKNNKPIPTMHFEDDGFAATAPVGSFPQGDTREGLKDMAGNVWEWTSSPYCGYPDETCGNDSDYVIRGGGYQTYQPRTLEATSRDALGRGEATETVGFRCARGL